MNPRLAVEIVGSIIWLPVELLVIAALLRGPYRRFPLLLAFVVGDFLTVAAEIPSYLAVYRGVKNAAHQQLWLYVLDEVVLQALIYAVVISLIYQATTQLKSRRVVAAGVLAGALVFAAASFAIHRAGGDAKNWGWVTAWTRDLNFCSAILDLGLWTLLISSRKKDSQLLLITGGLGIRFTGEAIGDSIRQLAGTHHSKSLSLLGGAVGMLAEIVSLFIWWQALRARRTSTVPSVSTARDRDKQKEGSRGTSATPF